MFITEKNGDKNTKMGEMQIKEQDNRGKKEWKIQGCISQPNTENNFLIQSFAKTHSFIDNEPSDIKNIKVHAKIHHI